MKKLSSILVLTLAINFLAVVGGVGWLYGTGRLDRKNVMAIHEILFAQPAAAPAATQPATRPATQPMLRLEDLLAQQAGRPATEQVEFIQRAFDAQQALLDRRYRDLLALRSGIDKDAEMLAKDRAALDGEKANLLAQKQEAERLAADKGFQDTLERYQAMSSKQVKAIFMALDDPTVKQYLQAMEPREAAKIIKEFKTPEETARIQRVLEMMRQAQGSAQGPAQASGQ